MWWTSCNEKLQIKVEHCLLDLWAGGPPDKKLYLGKRISESWCSGNSPRAKIEALPLVDVLVHGQHFKALVDTGCSMAILTPKACTSWVNCHHCVVAVDGSQIPCVGKAMVPLSIDGNVIEVNCLVAKRLFGNIDVVVGMDVIRRLGGVVVTGDNVAFPNTLGKSGILNKKVWSSDAKGKALKSELIIN